MKRLLAVVILILTFVLSGYKTDISKIQPYHPSTEVIIPNEILPNSIESFFQNGYGLNLVDEKNILVIPSLEITLELQWATDYETAQAIVDSEQYGCFYYPSWIQISGIICEHNNQNSFTNIRYAVANETIGYLYNTYGDLTNIKCIGVDAGCKYIDDNLYTTNMTNICDINWCDYIIYTCNENSDDTATLTYWDIV